MRSPDSTSPQVEAAPERTGARGRGSRFRPEVQGLRAVAVLLVLAYHLNPRLLPGGYVGVDVFFVISGFLITSLLLREVREHGRVSLAGFYVRRVRRLLPAATVVLLTTGAAALALLPVTRLADTAWQTLASAAYVENLYLADQALDYLAAETAPSPVQHFWSLSVEEQFYVVWPLLFVLWALMLRRRTRAPGSGLRLLTVVLASVFAASLLCSVLLTASGTPAAYFLPTTRAWELATGGLLAVFLADRGLPRRLRLPLGWAGLGAVVASAVLYDSGTPFPGYAALLPVLGTAAVIAAERSEGPSASRVLSTGPARFVGDVSYALYLWHWPLIVFALVLLERDTLGPLGAVAVAVLSVLLAWATKLWVEDPVARYGLVRTGRAALAVALVGVLSVAAVSAAALTRLERFQTSEFDPEVHLGPRAIGLPSPERALMFPSPIGAEDDTPEAYDDGCHAGFDKSDPSDPCVYGPDDADTTVALTGDSHSTQWFPALNELAEERGWRLVVFNKSACAFTAAEVGREGAVYEECSEWNRAVADEIDRLEPDMVVTSSSAAGLPHGYQSGPDARDAMAAGMVELWEEVVAPGVPLVVIRDTPRTSSDVLDCLARHSEAPSSCDRPASAALSRDDPQELAVREVEGAALVDLNDRICTGDTCPAVIGNVVVYRDSHHLTGTYALLLADVLGSRMDEALGVG
ncbi:acyltransferase family protein [Nocardiopsis sp. NPDC006938]|uniref:acyltransferase family protein n=1 Tax=Nocardiopsis sp. NPDC006938 TaxID=3364337 RepID=UPI00369756F5